MGERGKSNSGGNALQHTAVLYIHPPHPSQAERHPISGWRSQVPPSFHCIEGWATFNQAAKGSYCSLLGRSLNYRFTHPGSGKEPSVHRSESWSLPWALPRNGWRLVTVLPLWVSAFLPMGETLQILPSHNPYSAGLQTSPPTALGITGERPHFCLPGWPGPWHAKNRIL